MIKEPNKKTDGKFLWNLLIFILIIASIVKFSITIFAIALILKILVEIKYVILEIFLED